jgi:hypothetical protein
MHVLQRVSKYFVLSCAIFIFCSLDTAAQIDTNPGKAATQATTEERDGQHDFDFLFGQWKVHSRRLLHPLTGSNEWVEIDGASVVRPIWEGRGTIEEYEAVGPSGHVDGLTVQTYSPTSHQWSIYFTNSKNGAFSLPPTVGKFTNGRGEFYDQEDFNGTKIFVRYLWLLPSSDKPRWEQAFSADGGKTWETNYIVTYARVKQ